MRGAAQEIYGTKPSPRALKAAAADCFASQAGFDTDEAAAGLLGRL